MSNIDSLDKKILMLLSKDARMPFLEVSRACDLSAAAIRQRYQKLCKMGIIKGTQLVLNPEALGFGTCAFVGIFLKDPSDFDHVVEELSKMPEVAEVHYTTGNYDIFTKIYARSNHDLLSFIHDKLQPLGLQRTETIISFHEAVNRQLPISKFFEESNND